MKINRTLIFTRMIELDLTRAELCASANIGCDTLRKIEHGRMVALKSIKRICLRLGIPPKEVLVDVAPTPQEGSEGLGNGEWESSRFNWYKETCVGGKVTGATLSTLERIAGK